MFLVSLWFATVILFAALTHAKKAYEAGTLSLFWRLHFLPLVVAFLVCDCAFNVVFGTVMYAELPRELLFTSRCKRHKRGAGWRHRVAWWWCERINEFDPGHC